ncbi:sporulation protein YunB [Iocasia frigidifontis]|uniref:Sporulation protein YunB n=1 Tax=Iocasia fonsfrigidae TaxID=2682810 RepID=A0A8A7KKF0_9FIRM|nr:sporulation protein YunB [Halocella sp. SP3-1]QTL98574.1 sporulation protein YunB [Iocasia fonsfrigidae]
MSPFLHRIVEGGIVLFLNNFSICKILIVFIILLLLFFIFLHNTITPIFFSLAEVEAVKIANSAINEAVDLGAEKVDYQDMIDYVYNKSGDAIVLMQPNTKNINKFTSSISLRIQEKLAEASQETVSVPLAQIFGIELLAGFGPKLEARIIPAGFTEPPKIKDSFTSAGINQTRHKIYLDVAAQIKLIVPFKSHSVDIHADIPVTEVVILGKVPQVYVGIDGEGLSGILKGSQ